MKKLTILILALGLSLNLKAWWDPGHLLTAMVAYMYLDDSAKQKVDELTVLLQRDYPYLNHFMTLGAWPDDLKVEGVRTYDTWHYTNIPLNRSRIALKDQPDIDIIWAINQMSRVLRSSRSRDIDKARHLGFLVHFVGDIHQPLHSTTVYDNRLPGGNVGGNVFPLEGQWANLHMLWDDGCGYFSAYNDINPYGTPKDQLTVEEVNRLKELAAQIVSEHPKNEITGIELMDPDFWALESHKLAVRYGYGGYNSISDEGRKLTLVPRDEPSEMYLEKGKQIVAERIATAGYRLAEMLNQIFGED